MKSPLMFLFFIIANVCYSQFRHSNKPFEDWKGQEFKLYNWITTDGDTLDESFLEDKVCVYVFFALGCPPCMAEIKYMNDLYEELDSVENFCLMGVYRGQEADYDKFKNTPIRKLKASSKSNLMLEYSPISIPKYPVLYSDLSKFYRKYHVNGVPSVLIHDKDRVVQYAGVGFPMKKSDQMSYIEELKAIIYSLLK